MNWALFCHFLVSFLFANMSLIALLVGVAVLLDYGNLSAAMLFLLMATLCGAVFVYRWRQTHKHEITLTQKAAVGYYSLVFFLTPLAFGSTGLVYGYLAESGTHFVYLIFFCGITVLLYHLFQLLDFSSLPKREKILQIGRWGLYNPRLKSRRRKSRRSRRWKSERRF